MPSEVKHLTSRVLLRQIKALERIAAEEKVDRSAALRKVLDIGLQEYARRRAVENYRRGRVSIGRAAEEADMSIAEFYKVLADEGVTIRVDAEAIKDALRRDFGDQAG